MIQNTDIVAAVTMHVTIPASKASLRNLWRNGSAAFGIIRASGEARATGAEVRECGSGCCVACCTVASDRVEKVDVGTRTIRLENVAWDGDVVRFCVAARDCGDDI